MTAAAKLAAVEPNRPRVRRPRGPVDRLLRLMRSTLRAFRAESLPTPRERQNMRLELHQAVDTFLDTLFSDQKGGR
jgi:hypothetical protein